MFHLHRNQFRAYGGSNNDIHGSDVHLIHNKKTITYEDIIDNMIELEEPVKKKSRPSDNNIKSQSSNDVQFEIEDDTVQFGKEYSVGLM